MPDDQELHFRLLRHLADNPSTTQRDLAQMLSIGLGRMNYCIHALVDKGWIKVESFKRSDKKLRYVYLLTPQGIEQKLRLTAAFLKRKEAEYDALRAEIEELRAETKGNEG